MTVAENARLLMEGNNIYLADCGNSSNNLARLHVTDNGYIEHGHIYIGSSRPGPVEAEVVFDGNSSNHIWNDNTGYVMFVGQTSNAVGRLYAKDNTKLTFGQVRVAGDDANRAHDTSYGEFYIQDNADVTINNHLYLGRAYNSTAKFEMSGGKLNMGNCSLYAGDAPTAHTEFSMTGGEFFGKRVRTRIDTFAGSRRASTDDMSVATFMPYFS